LYGADFTADPHAVYERLRAHGPAAPVELAPGVPAMLVISYATALEVLKNPSLFARDSRRWRDRNEGRIPKDSPILPMMDYRPNALFSDGKEHARLRRVITDSLEKWDRHELRRAVERAAGSLMDRFTATGKADLIRDYARPLPLMVLNTMFGCPPELGLRIVTGMSGIFDGAGEEANAQLTEALIELVRIKRANPGEDVTSWMLGHNEHLNDEELINQLVTVLGAGTEPQQNLIASTVLLLLDEAATSERGMDLPVKDAIATVLWNSPPIANYAAHYPTKEVAIDDVTFTEGTPTLISFAAANDDPMLERQHSELNNSHLAFGAGPHACPAQEQAQLIAEVAIEALLKRLPDIQLAVPEPQLTWRPGPIHRALTSLPVEFAPVKPRKTVSNILSTDKSTQMTNRDQAKSKASKRSRWSSFLTWWRK
jgi:cytochrome P450